jgi:hypothetical protein
MCRSPGGVASENDHSTSGSCCTELNEPAAKPKQL